MDETSNTPETNPIDAPEKELQMPDELTSLKARAKTLGIQFHPSIGVDALRKKVSDHLNDVPETQEAGNTEAVASAAVPLMTANESRNARRREVRAEALKLVRLRITNLNPAKKDLHGEFFTVGNDFIGDVKKFIPFGEVSEDGYHVPNVLYKAMKKRKFLQVKTRKDPKRPGHMIIDQKWVPEFALEVLPQLTADELKDLGAAQAAAGE